MRYRELDRVAALSRIVVDLERTGIGVDVAYCNQQAEVARADQAKTLEDLSQWSATVNWASSKQLTELLHDAMGLTVSPIFGKGETKRGDRHADRVALQWIGTRHPEVKELTDAIVRLRRCQSGLKYMTKLPTFMGLDGFVHPVVGLMSDDDDRVGARTGRWGMKSPEVMQLPKDKTKDYYACRKAIVGGPGEVLIAADQSQLEMVILAHIAITLFGEPGHYLAKFLAEGAPDLHSSNARDVYGTFLGQRHPDGRALSAIPIAEWKLDAHLAQLRDYVKAIWYGLQYGKDAYGFGRTLLGPDGFPIGETRAGELVAALKRSQPAVQLWQDYVAKTLPANKYTWSIGGRISDLRDFVNSGNKWEFQKAYRKALNFPMQASGADIMADVMIAITTCPKLKHLGFKLCLQVHDEVVLRGPEKNAQEAMARVKYYMENTCKLALPLRCSVNYGVNYYDAK